ncbi:hypothetical protein [Acidisphaera sp. L21]|uniref:hypothetical protein n=1 Tax=Acidisphaera sp. L21 TaxID=1641851 RepID=UPI00131BB2CD|nr:hypothetical protein [Acidisphaera sp. L21]
MNFAIRSLSVLAYANGFTLWHYKGDGDTLSNMSRPGFFDDAADMLAGGDMVLVSAPEGGRVLCIAKQDGRVIAAALA